MDCKRTVDPPVVLKVDSAPVLSCIWHFAEDKIVEWHHQLNGHESEQTPRDSEAQWSLACCSSWGHRESDIVTEQQKRTTTKLVWGKTISFSLALFLKILTRRKVGSMGKFCMELFLPTWQDTSVQNCFSDLFRNICAMYELWLILSPNVSFLTCVFTDFHTKLPLKILQQRWFWKEYTLHC